MSILIADDDPVSSLLLERTLGRLGHPVVAVEDGAEAVAQVLRPDGPRLAILDWDMPGLDGPTACREIRKRPVPYVYIMMLTARDRLEDMILGLDAEADDFLTKPFNAVELGARIRSGERVLALQENLLRAQATLRHQATHDDLTGLLNRATIFEYLELELRRCRRAAKPLSIAIVDVDHFKRINDMHGHVVGDAALREVVQIMRSVLRDGQSLGRYGGEEFLLVLPDCDEAAAVTVAERARARVTTSAVHAGAHLLPVTISVGVACTTRAHDLEGLILAADGALYHAKSAGRNRVTRPVPDFLEGHHQFQMTH